MITTIRLKDLIKYLVVLIFIILISISATRFFLELRDAKNTIAFNKKNNNTFESEYLIELTMPIAKYVNSKKILEEKTIQATTSRSGISRMLSIELPNIENNLEENEDTIEIIDNNEDNILEQKEEDKQDTVKESYTNNYGSVKIKNQTDIKLTASILKPDYQVKNKEDIIIYHTHTCESYTQTDEHSYKASGNFRTTDLKHSVVKVGDVLKEKLEGYKFNVVHNNTKHDYPAYSGSYTRSLETIEKILKENAKTEIIFDIHRDAIGSNDKYAPTVEINGEKVAQLMFVIGTNDGGGKHPNWKNNLKFAVKIQEKANEMYPGLFRPINLRSATFNQKVSNAASIVEVGATGNTLEESTASMKYFANVLKEVLK